MPLYRLNSKIVFFVHIPKTGGSSIRRALLGLGCKEALHFSKQRNFSRATLQHMHADVHREAVTEGFDDFRFAVVRNPYDRLASEYRMRVLNHDGNRPFNAWCASALKRFGEYSYTNDNHMRPQSRFVNAKVQVFRFEDGIDKPIAAACKALGAEPPESIPHQRKGVGGKIPISRELTAMIEDVYEEDFANFGYDKDYGNAFVLAERSGQGGDA